MSHAWVLGLAVLVSYFALGIAWNEHAKRKNTEMWLNIQRSNPVIVLYRTDALDGCVQLMPAKLGLEVLEGKEQK